VRQSVRLGRVAGIEIGAHWSVLFIALLLGYGLATAVLPAGAPGHPLLSYVVVAAIFAVLFLAALLAHELAHSVVAKRHGVGVKRITLWLLGGVSELDKDAPTPRAEFLIAAAGPLTSLLIGGLGVAGAFAADAVGASRLVVVALQWLAGVNILLGVFNLLPGAPLDGGRVTRALVWRLTGDRDRAQIAADRAGIVLGVVLAALGLLQTIVLRNLSGLWLVLLGWFLITAARAETAGVRIGRALEGRRVRDIMATEPAYGHADQSIDDFVTTTAARHPHHTYPLLDDDRRPVGLVRLENLARIPQSERTRLPLRAAAEPGAAMPTVSADEPASAVVHGLSPANPLIAVTDHDQLVGVVATRDVDHAISLADLGNSGRH
jgi:Zn-dependent protease/CBS domain-containing protein